MVIATGTAMLGAAAIGAGASVVGASKAAKASKAAGDSQYAAALVAADEQRRQYDQTREDSLPFIESGQSAVEEQSRLLGLAGDAASEGYGSLAKPFTMADYQADPGYNFRLEEGQKAIDRIASRGGRNFSGRSLKDASRWGQDLASDEYGRAYDRYNRDQDIIYNRLGGLSGRGQSSSISLGNIGQSSANAISNLTTSGASARAAGNVAANNAWQSGLADVTNIAGNALGNYGSTKGWWK